MYSLEKTLNGQNGPFVNNPIHTFFDIFVKREKMALPIKETPILTRRDAVDFFNGMKSPVKISQEEINRIKENSERIKLAERNGKLQ